MKDERNKLMKRILTVIVVLLILPASTSFGLAEKNLRMFASDSVGVKLEYPDGWKVEEFKWGFVVTEPQNLSTITVKSQFFPKEYETAYDINLNEEFMKVYSGKFEELESGECEIGGLKWDYSSVKGAKGSPLEYLQKTYSILINNSLYSVEFYYNSNIPEDVKAQLQKTGESVKLMYKESELPIMRKYMKEYNDAVSKGTKLKYSALDNDIAIEYSPPWSFAGAGAGSEAGFHYFTGDPYKDIDMILIKHESADPREAIIALKTWVGLLTDTFNLEEENMVTYNNNKYHFQKLVQGKDEHTVHTWISAVKYKEGSIVVVFAFHHMALEIAPKAVEDLMKGITLKSR